METKGKETESPNLEGREMCEGETPNSVEIREGEPLFLLKFVRGKSLC